jgi:hypothetical protein
MTKVGAPTAARSWAFADNGSTVMASGRASVRSVDTTSPRMTTVMATIEAVAEKPLGQTAAFSQSPPPPFAANGRRFSGARKSGFRFVLVVSKRSGARGRTP